VSATVFRIEDFRQVEPTPEQQASDQVAAVLRERVTGTILAQAKARAERSVRSGVPLDDAVRRACAWALNESPRDPQPPNHPARAA
jgi:hypothetical protein